MSVYSDAESKCELIIIVIEDSHRLDSARRPNRANMTGNKNKQLTDGRFKPGPYFFGTEMVMLR
jgi:hypothetical protein